MADVPGPYVPVIPGSPQRGPGYTITSTPSAPAPAPPPRSSAPIYAPADTSGNQGYAAAGVVSLAAARQRKDAMTKAQKRALRLATKALKKGRYLAAAKGGAKALLRKSPWVATVLAGYSYLPRAFRKGLEQGARDDVTETWRRILTHDLFGRGVVNRRAPHTVSRTSNSLLKSLKLEKSSQALPVAPKPRVAPKPLARQAAGLAAPRKVSKVADKVAVEKLLNPKTVTPGRMPSIPTAPTAASKPWTPPARSVSPSASLSLPPTLLALLTAAAQREPRSPRSLLTPNNPVGVASPFIGSSPTFSFAPAYAPQTGTQKCGCKRRKKKGCGSGHFVIGADGREKFTYWSKSKCQPSKLKSASARASRTRTSSRGRRSNMRVAAKR